LLQKTEFQTNTARVQHRDKLNDLLAEAMGKQTLDCLMTSFKANGVPAGRIRDMKSVFEKPEAQAMVLKETTIEGIETLRMASVAFQIS
jgi:crotonobetainyl-CoA:carnitine CoA-transferase CaiB-like acyl-CoA transferase